MGLLDSILGGAQPGSSGGGFDAQQVMALVSQLLQQAGGLEGLLARLQKGGLGEAAQSWVGTGANQPVSGEQLGAALGPDLMGSLGGLLGSNGSQASSALAQVLPGLIDQLTPQGRAPAADEGDPLAALSGLLGGTGGGTSGGTPDIGNLLSGLLRR